MGFGIGIVGQGRGWTKAAEKEEGEEVERYVKCGEEGEGGGEVQVGEGDEGC